MYVVERMKTFWRLVSIAGGIGTLEEGMFVCWCLWAEKRRYRHGERCVFCRAWGEKELAVVKSWAGGQWFC